MPQAMQPRATTDRLTGPAATFVVIPARNEAKSLAAVVPPLIPCGYTVVVVDDGSTDGTWQACAELPVVRIRHPFNLGQGAALETGMAYARRHGANIVVHFDADGQHDYRQIAEMTLPIERGEADIVLGSRFLRAPDRRRIPWLKRLILRSGIIVSGVFSGLWLSDTHNGFRALSRKALDAIRLHENGFAHATEILSQIRAHRLRCVERPVTVGYSRYSLAKGQSPLNSLNILVDLLVRRVFR
jgi:glycosyltransferase involved in cell wall biosynthesis